MDVWHTFPSSSFDLSFRDFIIMVKASLGLESIANLAIFWWFFWFAKNQIVFRDTTLSIFATTSRVTNFIRDWNGAHDNDRKLLLPYYWLLSLLPFILLLRVFLGLLPRVVIVNFDGSKINDSSMVIGFVIQITWEMLCVHMCILSMMSCLSSRLRLERPGKRFIVPKVFIWIKLLLKEIITKLLMPYPMLIRCLGVLIQLFLI